MNVMKPRAWQRHHIRLTIRVIQTGSARFEIPLHVPPSTRILIDGSVEAAQQMADAISGCGPRCDCPAWEECEAPRETADMLHVEDTSLPQVSWRIS
jgi:hypothetical protein